MGELIKINGRKVDAVAKDDATKGEATTLPPGMRPQKATDVTQFVKNQGAAGLRAKMKAYSWNIFRYIGDYLHLTGIVVLFVTIGKNNSVAGISKSTQILYLSI